MVENLEQYLLYTHKICHNKFRRIGKGTSVQYDDIFGAAQLGLVKAAIGYDKTKNKNFIGYASIRISGEITDYLRSLDWTSRKHRKAVNSIDKVRHVLENKLKREPSEEEMSEALSISLTEYQKLRADWLNLVVLDLQKTFSNEGVTKGIGNFAVPKSRYETPEKQARNFELSHILSQCISKLPIKNKEVIRKLYWDDMSQREVASSQRCTDSNVSRRHSDAKQALKTMLESYGITCVNY